VLGTTPLVPLARARSNRVGPSRHGPLGAAAVALRERRALLLEPKFDEGWRLNEAELCCGDISDGWYGEMEKFAAVSGLAASFARGGAPSRTEPR